MIYRMIEPAEWHKLRTVYEQNGDILPSAENHGAAIAQESDGSIVGMFALNLILHAGPIWIAEDRRRQGIGTQLSIFLDQYLKHLGQGYLMFPLE